MTSFEAIRGAAHKAFGADPGIHQVRLWWFGGGQKDDEACRRRANRRQWAEMEIGAWEAVIKLAIRFAEQGVRKSGRRWPNVELWRLIYWILWTSPTGNAQKVETPKGAFWALTFWGWARENAKSERPTVTTQAKRNMAKALRAMLDNLEK